MSRSIAVIICMVIIFSGARSFYGSEADMMKASISLFKQADREYESGDHERAIELFNRVLTEYPRTAISPVAEYLLGRCYESTGREEKAVEVYRHLVETYKRGFWVRSAEKALSELGT